MQKLVLPPPSEKQLQFLNERHKFIAFGGARGGGKSWAVRVKAALLALRYPGIKIMIIRKTYPELQENHIIPMCEMLRCHAENRKDRIASYNDSKKHIVFPNGSRILFRYCDTDKDAARFQGTEIDVLFVDEATHQSEERMKKLTACVRGVNSFPKRVYYTMNPGGEGHAWVKRLFIDRHFNEGENADDYAFIQSLVTDNKALMKADPDYYKQLKALPPKLRDAWLYGNWDIFEGQFFEDFRTEPDIKTAFEAGCTDAPEQLRASRRWVHVIDPFEIPAGWKIYRGFDWGYAKPFSCAWYALDYDGVMYRILEFYGCRETPNEGLKWTPLEVFQRIHEIETTHSMLKGRRIQGIADPAIWNAERGESIAEVAAKCGVYFDKGDHERIAGWMQCHYRLAFDENGFPMFYVFSSCKSFIRTIPLLQYDDHKPEDLDTTGEDHIADEWRYVCMSRPIKPRMAPQPSKFNEGPLHQFLDLKESEMLPAQQVPRMEIINAKN